MQRRRYFASWLTQNEVASLPYPGEGQTLRRWQRLAKIAAVDLSIGKLFESHTDALAILHELGEPNPPSNSRWGVWASESAHAALLVHIDASGRAVLNGEKQWCSGAGQLTHALVTASVNRNQRILVAVSLQQRGIAIDESSWIAVGMANTATARVSFKNVEGIPVGEPAAYLTRPGFWHGAAGIAACWYGGALALAEMTAAHYRSLPNIDAHAAAHLGAIDIELHAARVALHDCAQWIDQFPQSDAKTAALRVRAIVERSAQAVLSHAGRAWGATPFCINARFAQMAADLPVFLRQSHAEHDLAALGEKLIQSGEFNTWKL